MQRKINEKNTREYQRTVWQFQKMQIYIIKALEQKGAEVIIAKNFPKLMTDAKP